MTPPGRPEPEAAPAALGGRRLILSAVAVAVAVAIMYVALPAIAGLDDTWRRLARGDPAWLVAAAALELASFASYMALFRVVFAPASPRIGWRESYLITMAGVVATRLLAVAGAGGIALTAWALRRLGVGVRELAGRMATFYVLLYGVYLAAVLIGGLGLYVGLFAGPAPPGLTLVPAIGAALVIGIAVGCALGFGGVERVPSRADGASRWRQGLAALPAMLSSGVRGGIELLRNRPPGLAGAIGWWAFDIAVLWACLEAFGAGPSGAVVVTAYFVGMAANVLPLPGGIGAVDGGMIAALIGFGVPAGPALVGVLSYRALAFWLPIIPGAIAYLQLLRDRPDSAPTT